MTELTIKAAPGDKTIAECADYISKKFRHVNVSRISAIIKAGRLPAYRVGRRVYVKPQDLANYQPLKVGWQAGRSRKQYTTEKASCK